MQMAQEHFHTFLFADISGYSRLTEQHGDEMAAELAISFAAAVERLAAEHGVEVVKRSGDSVMLHGRAAQEVVTLGLRLVSEHFWGAGRPSIHAGVHTGPAVHRADDWWGNAVNVASRVADAAGEGELLITETTRLAAGDLRPASLRSLGAMHFKNISNPVRVYATTRWRGTTGAALALPEAA
jgi:class 3 adenylate cyclase